MALDAVTDDRDRSSTPFFSVVIPTYNRKTTIAETLDSIVIQQFRSFECIVVDDGSTDETCLIIEQYPFVKLIRQQNTGPGSARNRGVQEAVGRYIAFLDSDDVWFPWTLRLYYEVILECGSPSFLAGTPLLFREFQNVDSPSIGATAYRNFEDYLSSGDEWLWYGVSSFVIRRDAFLKVGGFAEGHVNGEDAELALRLGEAPGFVHVEAPPAFAYRLHEGNVTLDRRKTEKGLLLLLDGERSNRFPGGKERLLQRETVISRHIRPFVIESARHGDLGVTCRLYGGVLREALIRRRWRFLIGVPLLGLLGFFQKCGRKIMAAMNL